MSQLDELRHVKTRVHWNSRILFASTIFHAHLLTLWGAALKYQAMHFARIEIDLRLSPMSASWSMTVCRHSIFQSICYSAKHMLHCRADATLQSECYLVPGQGHQ